MSKMNIRRGAMGALALTAAVSLALSGCARGGDNGGETASSPGITDDSVLIGTTTSLSGVAGAPGTCSQKGFEAFFESANADGGIKFGDGKTRKVNTKVLDDAYDPAKAVSNFRQLINDGMFANAGNLGTRTNLAIMPVAASEKVPQIFVLSGNTGFSSDQKANPWTLGWQPTYYNEGNAFGKFIAESGKPLTVAALYQNDDFGEDYMSGLKDAIEGSDVKIVAEATYEANDATVDAQMARLAESKADVFFNANSVTKLTASSLIRAQQLGWLPQVFLPSVSSQKSEVLDPGNAYVFPKVYTTAFSKAVGDPQYANDEDMKKFLDDMKKYSPEITQIIPHCTWGYGLAATLAKAFEGMKEPTRDALMDAIHNMGKQEIPLLLPGLVVDPGEGHAPINATKVSGLNADKAFEPLEQYSE